MSLKIIKKIESKYNTFISKKQSIIIKINGNNFSELTNKYFRKPFNEQFSYTVIRAPISLFNIFKTSFAYTQFDKISITIPHADKNNKSKIHLFNGRFVFFSVSTTRVVFNRFAQCAQSDAIFDLYVFDIEDKNFANTTLNQKALSIKFALDKTPIATII